MTRLPFEPLFALSGVAPDASVGETATAFGVTHGTIQRWRANGMTLVAADNACDHIGIHPCGVWGDTWIELALARTVRVIEPDPSITECLHCGTPIAPERRQGTRRRYCNDTCRWQALGQRRRKTRVS